MRDKAVHNQHLFFARYIIFIWCLASSLPVAAQDKEMTKTMAQTDATLDRFSAKCERRTKKAERRFARYERKIQRFHDSKIQKLTSSSPSGFNDSKIPYLCQQP